MLRTLYLKDFVIVDELALEFGAGFSVLSGETGAGKSILIDALGLVLGDRGSPELIREGCARAEIAAEWEIDNSAVSAWLQQQDIDSQRELLLRRTLDRAGRSRGFINGTAVTLTQLRELSLLLIDIHGQHSHQSLLHADQQCELLDRRGQLDELREQVTTAYHQWQAAQTQWQSMQANQEQLLREREQLLWQCAELEKLAPSEDEWAQIQSDFARLSHAQELLACAQTGVDCVRDADEAVLSQLNAYRHKLQRALAIDARLENADQLLETVTIQLQELAHELQSYVDKTELDEGQLSRVEARMSALHEAARRFRCAPEALPALWVSSQARLAALADPLDAAQLAEKVAALEAEYQQLAQRLSRARHQVAQQLAPQVSALLQTLNMEGGRFEVELSPTAAQRSGLDRVEFMVAGHAGVAAKPLAKIASGGELARIALAITVIAARATATPTLIFDEVDSGIGGAVAEVVGRLLQRLGQTRQVLCVTHLPQVASLAQTHFVVEKSQFEGTPRSRIKRLDEAARVDEIARMLGGVEMTAATRTHAQEWLQKGKQQPSA